MKLLRRSFTPEMDLVRELHAQSFAPGFTGPSNSIDSFSIFQPSAQESS